MDVELDGQGRITVHSELRRQLGLEGQELQLMPVKGHLEILTEALYEERKQRAAANTPADLKVLQKGGLR